MELEKAYSLIERAIDTGHPAHGYIISGSIRGQAMELALRILKHLFSEHVEDHANPDIQWVLPEGKARLIKAERMRNLVDVMGSTSFLGGWKAGVIVGADRLNKESANAFLKTLEEPTPNTIFLLLTEKPDELLPTIISRCQRIALDDLRAISLDEPFLSATLEVLSDDSLSGIIGRVSIGARLADVLANIKGQAEELVNAELPDNEGPGEEMSDKEYEALVATRFRGIREEFLRLLSAWFRDQMAVKCGGADVAIYNNAYRAVFSRRAENLTLAQCFRNIELIDEATVYLNVRNMQDAAVMSLLADTLSFGIPEVSA